MKPNTHNSHSLSDNLQVQAILFDLDGTLIDSEPAAALAVQECFKQWKTSHSGPNFTLEDAKLVTGRTWEKAFSYLFKKYSIPIPQEQAEKEIMNCYRKNLEEKLPLVPGSVQAVQSLSSHYPLALVSGSGRDEILWALKKLQIESHFKVICGAEDYTESKPSPAAYLKAVELLQTPPENCLVFEDSAAGIASARAAGLWVVAITSTNHFNQDVTQAHFQIPNLTAVTPEWIRNLSFD